MKRSFAWIWLYLFALSIPAFARGNRCVPQVVDGSNYHTKFDLVNISPQQSISGTFKLRFFHSDGTPWTLTFTAGSTQITASEYALALGPRQSIRVETLGLSNPTTSGYAIIEDNEIKNVRDSDQLLYSMDFVIGVSAYYTVYQGSAIVDTVTVNAVEATALGTFPAEVNFANNVFTGLAMVDLSGADNAVTLDLYASGTGTAAGSVSVTIPKNQQLVQFFHQQGLFPSLTNFKGIAEFKSTGPIAILALLETDIASGPQFATLVPTDREALRRNTYMAIAEGIIGTGNFIPVDLDRFVVDYSGTSGDEGLSWDLKYLAISNTSRQLVPATENFAQLAILGMKTDAQFDQLSLQDLKNLTYNANQIDFSDNSSTVSQINNAPQGQTFVFAVKTDLGNYAKLSVFELVTSGVYLDIVVRVVVYR